MSSRTPKIPLDAEDSAPALGAEAVTPSDTVNLSRLSRGIYVGVTGNVAAVMADGTVVTFVAAPAGQILPIQAIRINATNTTASSMISLY